MFLYLYTLRPFSLSPLVFQGQFQQKKKKTKKKKTAWENNIKGFTIYAFVPYL